MSMSVIELQSLPEDLPTLLHSEANLECCSFTCGSKSCGATCKTS
jgi:hypothetical protein